MHHAGLDHCPGPGGLDRLRQPAQAVAADDQDVLEAAVGQLGADPGPELGALAGLDPDAQDMPDPVHVDPDRDVRSTVGHVRSVADLDHQSIEVDHRIERLQRARLPGLDLFSDRLSDVTDRLVAEFHTQGRFQVMSDIAHRHPAGVQADDHLVQPTDPSGALGHQRRGERAVPIPRGVQVDHADLGGDPARGDPVAGVARAVAGRVVLLVPQMVGQLSTHTPLQDGLEHLGQEPARAGQRDTPLISGRQELINQLVVEHLPPQLPSRRALLSAALTPSPPSLLKLLLLRVLVGHRLFQNAHSHLLQTLRPPHLHRPSDTSPWVIATVPGVGYRIDTGEHPDAGLDNPSRGPTRAEDLRARDG